MNPTDFSLFIDDERFPPNDGRNWVIVRSSKEAQERCQTGVPHYISFDHDLGGEDTAMIFAHWMVEQDLDHPGFIPDGFSFYVHSQNNIGQKDIQGLLDGYLTHRDKEGLLPPKSLKR